MSQKDWVVLSGTKVFTNVSLSGYYKLLWSKWKKLLLVKKIASFWFTNGTVKIKLLNDQFRYLLIRFF